MSSSLQVKNLSVTYEGSEKPSIHDVNFELEKGSITALIGPNGSGKSTLIRAILGIIPHKGTVRYSAHPIHKSYSKIGYVPQRFSFDTTFPITVYEFLDLSSPDISQKNIEQLLDKVKLHEKIHSPLSSLSGGQLQRVLIVRALLGNPSLLILDEPEAGVDVGVENLLYDYLLHLSRDKGLTILIATHDLDVVSSSADRVLCLHGTIMCSGSPKKVLDEGVFSKLYGHELSFYGHKHGKDI